MTVPAGVGPVHATQIGLASASSAFERVLTTIGRELHYRDQRGRRRPALPLGDVRLLAERSGVPVADVERWAKWTAGQQAERSKRERRAAFAGIQSARGQASGRSRRLATWKRNREIVYRRRTGASVRAVARGMRVSPATVARAERQVERALADSAARAERDGSRQWVRAWWRAFYSANPGLSWRWRRFGRRGVEARLPGIAAEASDGACQHHNRYVGASGEHICLSCGDVISPAIPGDSGALSHEPFSRDGSSSGAGLAAGSSSAEPAAPGRAAWDAMRARLRARRRGPPSRVSASSSAGRGPLRSGDPAGAFTERGGSERRETE